MPVVFTPAHTSTHPAAPEADMHMMSTSLLTHLVHVGCLLDSQSPRQTSRSCPRWITTAGSMRTQSVALWPSGKGSHSTGASGGGVRVCMCVGGGRQILSRPRFFLWYRAHKRALCCQAVWGMWRAQCLRCTSHCAAHRVLMLPQTAGTAAELDHALL
jgi:hypothetical protein